jgi:hypothetical protein
MEKSTQDQTNEKMPPVSNATAVINHFREAIASGKHWYVALLESIRLWTDESESFQGHDYRYLIDGEAFDWLLLAERLCDSVNGLIPEKEKFSLIFQNQPPLSLTPDEFKDLIGQCKYHQYLNYFYGVTVEEALIQAVREEVRKERSANGLSYRRDEENEIFVRVYGDTEPELLKQFRKVKRFQRMTSTSLTGMKEFIYWRFKYRVKTGEKARVASDTQKALLWLKRHGVLSIANTLNNCSRQIDFMI